MYVLSIAVPADPRLRASCSQAQMVDRRFCRADAYLNQKTSALFLGIQYEAMPKQPSLG